MKSLIITGIYRSGSTLIQKVLSANSQTAIMNHGMIGFFQMMKSHLFRFGNITEPNSPLGFHWIEPTPEVMSLFRTTDFDTAMIDRLLQLVEAEIIEDNQRAGNVSHPTWVRGVQGPNQDWLSVLKDNLRSGTAKHVLDQQMSLILHYKQMTDAKLVGFKELHLEQFVQPMLADDPNLKVIQIIRDPRAVLASRNFSKSFLGTRGGGAKHPIKLIANVWTTGIRYKRQLEALYPNSFMSIKYESLIRAPHATTKQICTFLDINWDHTMLDVSSFRSEMGETWEPNTSFERLKGFDTKAIDNWRSRLPGKEHAVMEYLCAGFLEQEGYERDFNTEQQKAMFSTYSEHQDELVPWSRQPLLQIHHQSKSDHK